MNKNFLFGLVLSLMFLFSVSYASAYDIYNIGVNAHERTLNNDSTSVTYKLGVKFVPNQDGIILNASKSSSATDTNWYLYQNDCTSLLTSGSFSSNVAVINYNITAGTSYCLSMDKNGGSREFGPKYDGASLTSNTYLNWTARVFAGTYDANGLIKWVNITTGLYNLTSDNFSVSAVDNFDSSSISNFSVEIGGTNYSTTTGTITTNILSNATSLYNFTVFNVQDDGGYYNQTFSNINISTSYTASLSKLFRFYNQTFSNYKQYGSINYTRNLGYKLNYTCPSWSTTNLLIQINGVNNLNINAVCTNDTTNYISTYNSSTEGAFNISTMFNTSYVSTQNNFLNNNQSFTADLNNPEINYLNFNSANGFYNPITNVTLICNDTITPTINYTLTFNGNTLFFGNRTNLYTQTNQSTLINGYNNATGTCADFFSNTTSTTSNFIYAQQLCLIDEKDNTFFNSSNISGSRVYFDDNSTYFDFKTNLVSCVNYTSSEDNKLRFEQTYNSGTVITRFIDSALMSTPVRVCANKEGTTFYEQLIISATERPVLMKNIYSNCYVAGDYTRFAYQDGFVLRASTINAVYYLNTLIDGIETFLASIDGSIATYINIDTLEFRQQETTINLFPDQIFIMANGVNQSLIRYVNNRDNNLNATITITMMNNGSTLFSSSSFADPNNISIIFDYTLLGVNASTIFKVTGLFFKTDGTSNTIYTYFNPQNQTGTLPSGLSFIISLLLLIFGLTLTVSRTTLSWFGLIIVIASIGILTFAISTYYTTFLMVIEIIIAIFIVMNMILSQPKNHVGVD